MVKRTVVWTDTAKLQRRKIFMYWNNRNGSTNYSKRLVKHIRLRIDQLLVHPLSGKETDLPGVRITSLGHFSIVYTARPTQIVIVAFWDSRQEPRKLSQALK